MSTLHRTTRVPIAATQQMAQFEEEMREDHPDSIALDIEIADLKVEIAGLKTEIAKSDQATAISNAEIAKMKAIIAKHNDQLKYVNGKLFEALMSNDA